MNKLILTIVLFTILIVSVVLNHFGYIEIGTIIGILFTIISLIINLPKIKGINKSILVVALSIDLVSISGYIYFAFFYTNVKYELYGLYGSIALFIISIPIILILIEIDRRKKN